MVWIEVTPNVAKHKVAQDYPCVRVHFLTTDSHFHINQMSTERGESIANWMPKDREIAELLDKRLQAPNPLDALYELDQVLRKHGWELKKWRS